MKKTVRVFKNRVGEQKMGFVFAAVVSFAVFFNPGIVTAQLQGWAAVTGSMYADATPGMSPIHADNNVPHISGYMPAGQGKIKIYPEVASGYLLVLCPLADEHTTVSVMDAGGTVFVTETLNFH